MTRRDRPYSRAISAQKLMIIRTPFCEIKIGVSLAPSQREGDTPERMIEGFFLGLKFYIPAFFWVGKFGKYIFGCLNLGRDFLRIQNNLKLSSCIIYVIDETEDHVFGVSSVVRIQKAREIGMGFFFP